jgi:hypothetical protein
MVAFHNIKRHPVFLRRLYGKRWRWIVDKRMRDYDNIDFDRCIIRITNAMHRRDTVFATRDT